MLRAAGCTELVEEHASGDDTRVVISLDRLVCVGKATAPLDCRNPVRGNQPCRIRRPLSQPSRAETVKRDLPLSIGSGLLVG